MERGKFYKKKDNRFLSASIEGGNGGDGKPQDTNENSVPGEEGGVAKGEIKVTIGNIKDQVSKAEIKFDTILSQLGITPEEAVKKIDDYESSIKEISGVKNRLVSIESDIPDSATITELQQLETYLAQTVWDLEKKVNEYKARAEAGSVIGGGSDSVVKVEANTDEVVEENITAYQKVTSEIPVLEEQINEILSRYPNLKNDPVYTEYQTLLANLESKTATEETFLKEHSLVWALVRSVEKQVTSLENKANDYAIAGDVEIVPMQEKGGVTLNPNSQRTKVADLVTSTPEKTKSAEVIEGERTLDDFDKSILENITALEEEVKKRMPHVDEMSQELGRHTIELFTSARKCVTEKGSFSQELRDLHKEYNHSYETFLSQTEGYNLSLDERKEAALATLTQERDGLYAKIDADPNLNEEQKQEAKDVVGDMRIELVNVLGNKEPGMEQVNEVLAKWRSMLAAETTGLAQTPETKPELRAGGVHLLGMQIPRAGKTDAEGNPVKDAGAYVAAVSFRKGLATMLDRLESQSRLNAGTPQAVSSENQEKLRNLVARLAFIPESGLTQTKVEEIKSVAEETGAFENPARLDSGRVVEDMYKDLNEKLKAKGFDSKLGEIKRDKKRIFSWLRDVGSNALTGSLTMGLAAATALSLSDAEKPASAEVNEESPNIASDSKTPEVVKGVKDLIQTPDGQVYITTPPSQVVEGGIASTYVPDDGPTQVEQEVNESISSTYTAPTASAESSAEKLPDYTWKDASGRKKENIWDFAEGDIEGVEMLPALAELPKERRNHILDHVRTALIMSKEWRKKVGVKVHPDKVYVGDVIHAQALNDLIIEVVNSERK